jgi:type II secretory pathway component PulM
MPTLKKLQAWWRERSGRERWIFTSWTMTVAVLVFWFGVCNPLFGRIAVLEKRVPELEMLLNRMRTQQPVGQRVGVAAQQTGEDLRGALYGRIAEHKISAELRALSPSRVEMRLPEMSMPEALEVLDNLRRQTGSRVVVFSAKSDASSGQGVRVVAELERKP